MGKERRRQIRYVVPDEQIVIPVDFSNNIGKIKNIGWGGVQFEYLAANFNNSQWDQIDILSCKNNRSILSRFPCEVIYDIKSLSENGSFTGMDVRICGLRFVDLSQQQSKKLRRLLARLVCRQ